MSSPIRLNRASFLTDYWSYRPGQHVTFLGPTGSGKTFLKWQVLQYTASRANPVTVFATKPRDATTEKWGKKLGYRVIRDWPPPKVDFRRLGQEKPKGRILWPRHFTTDDIDAEEAAHADIFRRALMGIYKSGNQIVDIDEVLDLVDLKLHTEMRVLWTRGRSMKAGLWAGTQRPFDIPQQAYGQAQHLFVALDPDQRARDRYNEIGGFDGKELRDWCLQLQKHEFLYVCREDRTVAIIESE
jgi:hypothetical protein